MARFVRIRIECQFQVFLQDAQILVVVHSASLYSIQKQADDEVLVVDFIFSDVIGKNFHSCDQICIWEFIKFDPTLRYLVSSLLDECMEQRQIKQKFGIQVGTVF